MKTSVFFSPDSPRLKDLAQCAPYLCTDVKRAVPGLFGGQGHRGSDNSTPVSRYAIDITLAMLTGL